MVEKTCTRCGFTGGAELFRTNTNTCKNCIRAERKRYRAENHEKELERCRRYRINNPEKVKESRKRYSEENPEKIRESSKRYRDAHIESERERCRLYRQTPSGIQNAKKYRAKRRSLGHEPINKWFKGSEAHHLRYSKTHEEQDNNITMYVPRKLHRSIYHNGNTGQGMREINVLLLEWYFQNTPEEEQNPKAKQLYWNYCTLPDPVWSKKESE